jgi:predicted house-cleaning NTP pyrophosphatase (Maf/HAM1 superfamily)
MKLTGLELRVAAPEVDEKRQRDESPRDMTRRLALAKAKAVEIRGGLVLGADTVVVDGFEVLGKPENSNGARQMLEALRGRSHQVVTSIAFFNPETGSELVDTCESNVPMRQYRTQISNNTWSTEIHWIRLDRMPFRIKNSCRLRLIKCRIALRT